MPHVGIHRSNAQWNNPSNKVEPPHERSVLNENNHKSQMEMESLTEHPEVVCQHEVLQEYMK